MKTYSIISYTDPYHGSRASGYKRVSNTRYAKTLRSGLSLKEAQNALLEMFSEEVGHKVANWGVATRIQSVPGLEASPTYKDGTRSYSEDVWTYYIEEEG